MEREHSNKIHNNTVDRSKELTWGCSALKGGIPTITSNKITPTDHQSAVVPAENYTESLLFQAFKCK